MTDQMNDTKRLTWLEDQLQASCISFTGENRSPVTEEAVEREVDYVAIRFTGGTPTKRCRHTVWAAGHVPHL